MKNKTRWITLLAVTALIFAAAAVAQQKSDDKAVDPVCGMTVVKAGAKAAFDYKGTKYYFCSTGCKDAFAKEPEKFLQKKVVIEVREKEVVKEGTGCKCMTGKNGMRGMEGKPGAEAMPGMPMMGRPDRMGMMPGPMMGGVNRLLLRRDVDWTFERTADGVTVKITSKDPETIKAIQERLAMAKEMKETMAAPAAPAEAGKGAPGHSCENCPMKKTDKI